MGHFQWCQDDITEAATFIEFQGMLWRQRSIRGDDLEFTRLQGANIGQAFQRMCTGEERNAACDGQQDQQQRNGDGISGKPRWLA